MVVEDLRVVEEMEVEIEVEEREAMMDVVDTCATFSTKEPAVVYMKEVGMSV